MPADINQSSYDAIIIGAGLGGLAAAAVLAHSNKSVLLIEQHSVLGGYASSFRRLGYNFEVAFHAIDGNASQKTDFKLELFSLLHMKDNLRFVRSPELYRYIGPDFEVVVPDDAKLARDTLCQRFPHEKHGIDEFFNLMASAIQDPIQAFMMYQGQNVGEFLDRIFVDEKIKLILGSAVHYYHDDPYSLSLPFFAIAQGSYYHHGNYFIQGGSQALCDQFTSIIKRGNGVIRAGHEATQIIMDSGQAVGVGYRNKKTQEEYVARGRVVIANAPILQVVNRLMPPGSLPANYLERVNQMQPSMSITAVYLCLNRNPGELGNNSFNTFLCDHLLSLKGLSIHQGMDLKTRPLEITNYQRTETGLNSRGKFVLSICFADTLSYWEGLPSQIYKKRKEEIGQALIQRCDQYFPGLASACEYLEVGTPKTMLRYTKNDFGSVYGFAQTTDQSGALRLSARTPVSNLFFASNWNSLGGGMTGAMLAGYLTAKQVLGSIQPA
jgi:all-trans-retinol 13,14-reductase